MFKVKKEKLTELVNYGFTLSPYNVCYVTKERRTESDNLNYCLYVSTDDLVLSMYVSNDKMHYEFETDTPVPYEKVCERLYIDDLISDIFDFVYQLAVDGIIYYDKGE